MADARRRGPRWLRVRSGILTPMMTLALIVGALPAATATVSSAAQRNAALVTEGAGDLPNFAAMTDVRTKKAEFFEFLLPLIRAENAAVRKQRSELLRLQARLQRGKRLERRRREWLRAAAERYRVEYAARSEAAVVAELLARVDVIPPSLALAQAASESAWGTSRFARDGNNLFGEWCFEPGCGLVPQRRRTGASHEVRAFDSPRASVASYFRNLNAHPAYAPLRQLRRTLRRDDEPLLGRALAAGLERYSERGEDYIADIRAIIRVNRLGRLDATLAVAALQKRGASEGGAGGGEG